MTTHATTNQQIHPYTATIHARKEMNDKKSSGVIALVYIVASAVFLGARVLYNNPITAEVLRSWVVGSAVYLTISFLVAAAVAKYFDKKMQACFDDIKKDAAVFKTLDPVLQANDKFVIQLICQNHQVYDHISAGLKIDHKIAANYRWQHFASFNSMPNNILEDFLNVFLDSEKYKEAKVENRDKLIKDFIFKLIPDEAFRESSISPIDTKEDALVRLENNPYLYTFLPFFLQEDPDIARLAIEKLPLMYGYVPVLTSCKIEIKKAYHKGMADLISQI